MALPNKILKDILPKNGMAWEEFRGVLGSHRKDRAALHAIQAIVGVALKPRDVQIFLCRLVDDAAKAAYRVDPDVGTTVDHFLACLHRESKLAAHIGQETFSELFRALVLGRNRFQTDRFERDLPEQNPTTHCALARSVDQFERAAFFWSRPTIELEEMAESQDRAADGDDEWDDDEFVGVRPSSEEEEAEDDDDAMDVDDEVGVVADEVRALALDDDDDEDMMDLD
ncbi:hypothetical protein B0T24DRAFT_694134 [Lasiosphaeria ovina]|uniref:Uncharacterized protein n=1 Tax=Lasiosphaeria ovina TaxID=92902 RepID=A0AAE0NDH4_9PEZI|nr:hypothetical protein B0T24DRAFT_694134 [Lasiosphaeria ovina]